MRSTEGDHLQPPGSDAAPDRALVGVFPAAAAGHRRGIAAQRRRWTRRADSWDEAAGANPGLVAVVDAVVAEAGPEAWMEVLDLGCGSGQLTIPVARRAAAVLAVDISPAMIGLLKRNAREAGLRNVEARVCPLEELALPRGSVDLVVSSYALHHLADDAKELLVMAAAEWLRPGGRLVIGDMMFSRGADARDRAIIRAKLLKLMRLGPGGSIRVVKNVIRFTLRTSERPLSVQAWRDLLERAGFERVDVRLVVAEAAVVHGGLPDAEP